jgi:hypothetical protein
MYKIFINHKGEIKRVTHNDSTLGYIEHANININAVEGTSIVLIIRNPTLSVITELELEDAFKDSYKHTDVPSEYEKITADNKHKRMNEHRRKNIEIDNGFEKDSDVSYFVDILKKESEKCLAEHTSEEEGQVQRQLDEINSLNDDFKRTSEDIIKRKNLIKDSKAALAKDPDYFSKHTISAEEVIEELNKKLESKKVKRIQSTPAEEEKHSRGFLSRYFENEQKESSSEDTAVNSEDEVLMTDEQIRVMLKNITRLGKSLVAKTKV